MKRAILVSTNNIQFPATPTGNKCNISLHIKACQNVKIRCYIAPRSFISSFSPDKKGDVAKYSGYSLAPSSSFSVNPSNFSLSKGEQIFIEIVFSPRCKPGLVCCSKLVLECSALESDVHIPSCNSSTKLSYSTKQQRSVRSSSPLQSCILSPLCKYQVSISGTCLSAEKDTSYFSEKTAGLIEQERRKKERKTRIKSSSSSCSKHSHQLFPILDIKTTNSKSQLQHKKTVGKCNSPSHAQSRSHSRECDRHHQELFVHYYPTKKHTQHRTESRHPKHTKRCFAEEDIPKIEQSHRYSHQDKVSQDKVKRKTQKRDEKGAYSKHKQHSRGHDHEYYRSEYIFPTPKDEEREERSEKTDLRSSLSKNRTIEKKPEQIIASYDDVYDVLGQGIYREDAISQLLSSRQTSSKIRFPPAPTSSSSSSNNYNNSHLNSKNSKNISSK
ncbi:hypothetical protein ADUPG1_010693, partial [Aduncisulcus paluster]